MVMFKTENVRSGELLMVLIGLITRVIVFITSISSECVRFLALRSVYPSRTLRHIRKHSCKSIASVPSKASDVSLIKAISKVASANVNWFS